MVANNQVLLKWSNIIVFVFTVIVNSLAGSTTLIGGVNTAQISDSNPTLVTPAGYVFSIARALRRKLVSIEKMLFNKLAREIFLWLIP